MYAFEAGELDAYRTSMQANMDCKEAIEQTNISTLFYWHIIFSICAWTF